MSEQTWQVGKKIEDFCRPCKSSRSHTITLLDSLAAPERVICDTCGSKHAYRGGESRAPERRQVEMSSEPTAPGAPDARDLEALLRRVLREETGWTPTALAEKWRGGELVMRPGRGGLQEKTLAIDVFFRKIVAVRNKLRVLEQQVNGADVPDELKIRLQSYITGCYGSLTSFNVLFANDEDRIRGTGGEN